MERKLFTFYFLTNNRRNMRVPLKIQGVTDVNSENMFSLLIVTDIKEERQMAIMVDPSMRHEFALRRGKYVGNDV